MTTKKHFKFRLERVLSYRRTLRKEAEGELAKKNHELNTAEESLENIITAQDTCPEPEEVMTMSEFALASHYKERLQAALVNQRLLILEAARAVEDAREAYVQRAIDAKALETVRERRHEEHKDEQRRIDRKDNNERTTQRHRFSTALGKGGDKK